MSSKEYEMYAALTRGQCEIVNALTRIADILIEMLAIDTVPVRYGKWMSLERSEGKVFCSNCKKAFDWDTEAQYYDYCPNCGARMDELIDTYLAERGTRKGYYLSKQSVQNDTNGRLVNEKKGNKSICESCGNISCIYQSGIYREKCDFYKGIIMYDSEDEKDKLESIGLGKKNGNDN